MWLIYGNYEQQIKSHKNIVFDMEDQSFSNPICQLTPSMSQFMTVDLPIILLYGNENCISNSCFTGLSSEKFSYNCQLIF